MAAAVRVELLLRVLPLRHHAEEEEEGEYSIFSTSTSAYGQKLSFRMVLVSSLGPIDRTSTIHCQHGVLTVENSALCILNAREPVLDRLFS